MFKDLNYFKFFFYLGYINIFSSQLIDYQMIDLAFLFSHKISIILLDIILAIGHQAIWFLFGKW